jgi:leader peptidase (prepilin peptidase)/N-methyltransferase
VIDLTTFRLPDTFTLPLILCGTLFSFVFDPGTSAAALWSAMSAGLAFLALFSIDLIYERLRGRSGIGLGDAKLFAAAGAWLGAEALPSVLLIASMCGILAVLAGHIRGLELSPTTAIAFGPFLALGFWLTWLYGPPI